MASKRVEMAKQLKLQGTVQINTSVDDAQKSIEELINAGVRTHEQNRNQHFQRKAKLPSSFYQPRTLSNSCKSRGSSVGHSREGSSDDGIGGGISGGGGNRHTLSPGSSSIGCGNASNNSFGMNPLGSLTTPVNGIMSGIVHQRQASAPALINFGIMEQQQQQQIHQHQRHPSQQQRYDYSTSRARAIPGSSGLPPVAHTYSKSLNTVTHLQNAQPAVAAVAATSATAILPHHTQHFSLGGQLPPIVHQRSVKSCDFEATIVTSPEANLAGISSGNFDHFNSHNISSHGIPITAGDLATNDAFYNDNKLHSNISGGYWTDPRAKSQSLDPMTLSAVAAASPSESVSIGVASCSSTSVGNSQQHYILQHDDPHSLDDGLGTLPDGWAKAYDHNNDLYFIDHINKVTTWYDPRISKELQEERINLRHSSFNRNSNSTSNNSINNNPNLSNKSSGDSSQHIHLPQLTTTGLSPNLATNLTGQEHLLAFNAPTQQAYPTGSSIDRIQQLKMERNYMLERQQQLCREGLLDHLNQQQHFGVNQPPPHQSHRSPQLLQHDSPSISTATNELQQQTHQPFYHLQQQANQQQQHSFANRADFNNPGLLINNPNDSAMEVDYQQSGANNTNLHHQIDPSFVQDLNTSDLNPREFDKYLQITDHNRQQYGVMRH